LLNDRINSLSAEGGGGEQIEEVPPHY
jgi:hypothetical protein